MINSWRYFLKWSQVSVSLWTKAVISGRLRCFILQTGSVAIHWNGLPQNRRDPGIRGSDGFCLFGRGTIALRSSPGSEARKGNASTSTQNRLVQNLGMYNPVRFRIKRPRRQARADKASCLLRPKTIRCPRSKAPRAAPEGPGKKTEAARRRKEGARRKEPVKTTANSGELQSADLAYPLDY